MEYFPINKKKVMKQFYCQSIYSESCWKDELYSKKPTSSQTSQHHIYSSNGQQKGSKKGIITHCCKVNPFRTYIINPLGFYCNCKYGTTSMEKSSCNSREVRFSPLDFALWSNKTHRWRIHFRVAGSFCSYIRGEQHSNFIVLVESKPSNWTAWYLDIFQFVTPPLYI